MYSLIGFASLLISKAHFPGFSRDLYVSIVLYMFDVQEGGQDRPGKALVLNFMHG